jgi:hypothetical protein
MKKPVMFAKQKYNTKHVEVYITQGLVNFLRLTRNHWFIKEMLKGVQKSTVVLMNEMSSQLSKMNAVYSGFMRSHMYGYVMPVGGASINNQIYGQVGTDAWYDVLVHEGLGIHHKPKQAIPSEFRPSADQVAMVPSFAEKRRTLGYGKRSPQIARPFITEAFESRQVQVLEILGNSVALGLRNTIAGSSGMSRRKLSDVLKSITAGSV